jgi:hypothetical protein
MDNIKMDLRETGWDGIDLEHDTDQWRALVKTIMNLRGSMKCWFLSSCTIGSFSSRAQLRK